MYEAFTLDIINEINVNIDYIQVNYLDQSIPSLPGLPVFKTVIDISPKTINANAIASAEVSIGILGNRVD